VSWITNSVSTLAWRSCKRWARK